MRALGGAVITGAAGGLGREIAMRLGTKGFDLTLTDVDGGAVATIAAEIVAAGGRARGLAVDVRDQSACRRAARSAAEEAGFLSLWVNNAGVITTGPLWAQDDAQRALMFEVNALGAMHGTVAALEVMRPAGHGHVINIASLAGLVAVPGEGVYAATKHAVVGLSTSTLADLRAAGERHVHISCVCPDGIWTPMLFDKLDDPQASLSFSGQLLTPEVVAEAVVRLVDRPRAVVALPRWRGVQVRLFALTPGLGVRLVPFVVRLSRAQQRSAARRLRSSKAGDR